MKVVIWSITFEEEGKKKDSFQIFMNIVFSCNYSEVSTDLSISTSIDWAK